MVGQGNILTKQQKDPELPFKAIPGKLNDQDKPPTVNEPDSKETMSVEDGDSIHKSAPPPAPPSFPDGGFTAWLQCAGSFFMFFNCWGVVNSFGR